MFKMFAKKEEKEMYEIKVVCIETGEVETVVTDKKGLAGLAINGYDVIEMVRI